MDRQNITPRTNNTTKESILMDASSPRTFRTLKQLLCHAKKINQALFVMINVFNGWSDVFVKCCIAIPATVPQAHKLVF